MKKMLFNKKINLKGIITVLTAIFISVSCEDTLDEEPRGFRNAVPAIENLDVLPALNGALYSLLKQDFIYRETGYHTVWGDRGVDILGTPSFGGFNPLFVYTYEPTFKDFNDFWSEHYKSIQSVNTLLLQALPSINTFGPPNALEPEKDADNIRFANYVGGIYFVRAILYFNLVKAFESPVIANENAPTEVKELVNEELPANSTPKQVYELIISDLEEAIGLLSNDNGFDYGVASKAAAQGLLGRVNLQIAGMLKNKVSIDPTIFFQENSEVFYERALTNLRAAKSSGKYRLLPSFGNIFNSDFENENNEILFGVRYETTGSNGGSNFGTSYGPDGSDNGNGSGANGGVACLREFSYSFFDDKTELLTNTNMLETFAIKLPFAISDTRFLNTIATYSIRKLPPKATPNKTDVVSNWGPNLWNMNKFRRKLPYDPGLADDQPIDFCYLRYADILLMEAEVLINSDNLRDLPLATELINQVRRRAFNVSDPTPGLTIGEALEGKTSSDFDLALYGFLGEPFHSNSQFGNFTDKAEDAPTISPAGIQGNTGIGKNLIVNYKPGTQAEMLEALMRERRKEFAGEGLRKDDLIRNGIWEEVARTVGNGIPSVYSEVYDLDGLTQLNPETDEEEEVFLDFTGVTVNFGRANPSLNIESHEYRWPIPQAEIDLNPKLKQNPGY